MKKETEPVKFLFGTPQPVRFSEKVSPEAVRIELKARIAGKATVTGYDTKLNKNPDELAAKLKAGMPAVISRAISGKPEQSLLKGNIFANLSEAIKNTLAEDGYQAEIEIAVFALTPESEELYKTVYMMYYGDSEENKGLFPGVGVLRPATEEQNGLERNTPSSSDFISPKAPASGAPVPPNVPVREQVKMPARFCRRCGTKRQEGAFFCTVCGFKFDS